MSEPSLFYYLNNHRLVKLERLIWALRYQIQRPLERQMSFVQILMAFNDLHHQAIANIRQHHPQLDEEPLGHLLVDRGYLSQCELDIARSHARVHQNIDISKSLLITGITRQATIQQALLSFEEQIAQASLGKVSILYLLRQREQALKLFVSRLLERKYLSLEQIKILGIDTFTHLPLMFKPLLDMLIMNADFPDYLAAVLRVEHTPWVDDPIWHCLKDLSPALKATCSLPVRSDKHPLLVLQELGLLSARDLSTAVMAYYQQQMQSSVSHQTR